MAKPGFYAVARGREVGIYKTWDVTLQQVNGFPGALHKKFPSHPEAKAFLEKNGVTVPIKVESDLEDLDFSKLSISDRDTQVSRSGPILAYCAGSAPGNGDDNCRSGYACLAPFEGEQKCSPVIEDEDVKHTNNRAAWWATIAAIDIADRLDPLKERELHVFTCNEVLVKTMNEWIEGWAANGWRNREGKRVKNADLLVTLRESIEGRIVEWRYIAVESDSKESAWVEKARDEAKTQSLLAAAL